MFFLADEEEEEFYLSPVSATVIRGRAVELTTTIAYAVWSIAAGSGSLGAGASADKRLFTPTVAGDSTILAKSPAFSDIDPAFSFNSDYSLVTVNTSTEGQSARCAARMTAVGDAFEFVVPNGMQGGFLVEGVGGGIYHLSLNGFFYGTSGGFDNNGLANTGSYVGFDAGDTIRWEILADGKLRFSVNGAARYTTAFAVNLGGANYVAIRYLQYNDAIGFAVPTPILSGTGIVIQQQSGFVTAVNPQLAIQLKASAITGIADGAPVGAPIPLTVGEMITGVSANAQPIWRSSGGMPFLDFDAIDDGFEFPDLLQTGESFSVVLVARQKSVLANNTQRIIAGDGINYFMSLADVSGYTVLGGNDNIVSQSPLSPDKLGVLIHTVGTLSRAYLNGENITIGSPAIEVPTGFGVGACFGRPDPANAKIYEVRIYRGELTEAEVVSLTQGLLAAFPPDVGFTKSDDSGSAPLTVNFTDTSTNSPTAWEWDFGDGEGSTAQNPSHTFAAGIYTVTHNATNANGRSENVAQIVTVILGAPIVIGSTFTFDKIQLPFYHSDPEEMWESVTREHEYEDGGKSFNELNTAAPIQWTLIYNGIDARYTNNDKSFDNHYSTYRTSRPFTFVDKWGNVNTNVYYKSYKKSHNGNQSWVKQREIVLIKYP